MDSAQPWDLLTPRLRERLARSRICFPSRPDDRLAAVLLLLTQSAAGPSFIGVVRTPHGTHGGQFALPGGHLEDGESAWQAATREAAEEVGLDSPIVPLGELGEFNTAVSRHRVQVQVGLAERIGTLRRDPREIAGVFLVPVRGLLGAHRTLPRVDDVRQLPLESGYDVDLRPHLVDGVLPERGPGHSLRRGGSVLAMPYVWGLTARILYSFLETVWIPSAADRAAD